MANSGSVGRNRRSSRRSDGNITLRTIFDANATAITAILNVSTIGIVICDNEFRCTLMNHVFASMRGSPVQLQIGNTIAQVFGPDAPQIEPALRQVWDTGKPLSNLEITGVLPRNRSGSCLAVNLRPIKDGYGTMHFIAAIFSDATARKKLQKRLDELLAGAEANPARPQQQPLEAEFAEVLAESARVLRHGIDMLRCSTIVRCHLSEIRIVNAFLPSSLFVALEEDSDKLYMEALLHMVSLKNQNPDEVKRADEVLKPKSPSPRERQIVRLIAEGKANKEIAAILALSTRTVESYRARLMEKLDLHSVGELVRYAFRNHILEV